MKPLLLIITILWNFSIIGQTAITKSDFLVVGDSIGVSSSTDFTIDYTTTGANSTWDFSDLTENNQLFEIAHDVSTAGFIIGLQFGVGAPNQYKASFYQSFDGLPLAQLGGLLPVNIESINRMVKTENDKVTYPGYSLKVSGQQVGFRSDTIETAYILPLNYGDTYASRGYTNIGFSPIYNAQIIQYRQRESTVDGEGQLLTPFGTYEVIRIHHQIEEQDSIRIDTNPWIKINRTFNEYEWWAKELKRPVLKIETEVTFGNEMPTRITYLNGKSADLNKNTFKVALFPNPTSDQLTIAYNENIKAIHIYSLDGKKVFSQATNSKEITIDISYLEPGMYSLHAMSENGQSFNPIVIK